MNASLRLRLGTALLLASACSPPPARETPVGRTTRAFVDSSRTNWTGQALRPLAATVWYPAAAGTAEEDWGVGVFRFGRGARDAAFADASPRPLILLSHGTGAAIGQLSWLAEMLVQEGYVVAGVNHHGNTAAEDRAHPAGFVLPQERALDLSVLLNRLASDSVIGPHLDTTRVGAAGFSLGGYTVLALAGGRLPPFAEWQLRCAREPDAPGCALPPEAPFTMADVEALARNDSVFRAGMARGERSARDPRVRAVFAMAPALVPLLDTASLRSVDTPLRVVLAGDDTQVLPSPAAAVFARFVPTAMVETRPGVGHYAFLAECTWRGRLQVRALCSDGGAERAALHAAVAKDAARFFAARLGRSPS